ncbi:MAG: lipoate--protein ligase family protein [Prevotella sp.]|nr:lipoate--protein ligase family protein [Prevotella sp.]
MKYVALPFQEPRRLSFYLAMEEFVARHTDEPDAFFMWQVEPSVIFGRNQVLENEVNVAYCREHGISLYRRKSGGGCVYADMDNLMLSFVTSEENVNFAFNRFVNMVLLVLRKLGIAATGTSHNDIMIGDRKVCGTACYHLEGRSIVHSTMLFDTNMDHMLNAITPSREKLAKKGIESVRQRITLLKDYTTLDSVEALKALIRETLCEGERMLTAGEVAGIEAIEATYLKEEFINLL